MVSNGKPFPKSLLNMHDSSLKDNSAAYSEGNVLFHILQNVTYWKTKQSLISTILILSFP